MIRRYKQSRICFVGTHYALLLYLLHSSYDEIKDTYFIFGEGMDEETASRFEHKTLIRKPKIFKKNDLIGLAYSFYFRLFILRRFSESCVLYAQDHLKDSKTVIGNKSYILIEDSKFKCRYYRNEDPAFEENRKVKGTLRYTIKKFFYGGTVYGVHGDNIQCKAALMSVMDVVDYLNGKKIIVCDLKNTWNNSVNIKKNLILDTFNFKTEDIDGLSRDVIIYTQPLYPDVLTKEEHIQLYKKVISYYQQNDLVVKVHPRDVVDYEELFPQAYVYRKRVPSQLLEIMGLHNKKAITFFSSAVQNIDYPIEIDWYGTEVSEKLFARFGHCEAPLGSNVCTIE